MFKRMYKKLVQDIATEVVNLQNSPTKPSDSSRERAIAALEGRMVSAQRNPINRVCLKIRETLVKRCPDRVARRYSLQPSSVGKYGPYLVSLYFANKHHGVEDSFLCLYRSVTNYIQYNLLAAKFRIEMWLRKDKVPFSVQEVSMSGITSEGLPEGFRRTDGGGK